MRFNPPPRWPVPPNWQPSQDWEPDAAWPPAPAGWQYWIADGDANADGGNEEPARLDMPAKRAETAALSQRLQRALPIATSVAAVVLLCGAIASIAYHIGKADRPDEATSRGDGATSPMSPADPPPTNPSTFILRPDWPPYSSPEQPTGYLAAPSTTSPADGAVFSNYPRNTDLWWHATTGAATYRVQLQYYDGVGDNQGWHDLPGQPNPITTSATTYHFEFVGAQPGRWRVTAVAADGEVGTASPWRTFEYTQ